MGNEGMSAGHLLKQANQLKRAGKLDEAIALYHQAIELNPDFAWTYDHLGDALLKKGHLDEAITEYERAIKVGTNRAFFYYQIGRAKALQNRVDEAIAYFCQAITLKQTKLYLKEAIKLQPENSEFYRLLAITYRKKGDTEKAIVSYQQAIELSPQSCFWNYKELGDILSSQQRWHEAITVYGGAVKLYPQHRVISSSMTATLFGVQHRNMQKLDEYEKFIEFVNQAIDYSYSQKIQDLWGLWESRNIGKGYFVEFGALSGINVSNTYLMELLDWDGIVAEPHPDYREILSKNRKCNISNDAVYSVTGKELVFKAVVGSPALSTLELSLPEDNTRNIEKRKNARDYIVKTISLNDLLNQFDAPSIIDFISIDTEGSELEILSTFDFTKYAFRAICIEYGTQEKRHKIFELLTQHNYMRKWEELSEHDDWYVNKKICHPTTEDGQKLLNKISNLNHDLIPTANNKKKKQIEKFLVKGLVDSKQAQETKYRTCAIFQLEGVHEVIIPTLVYAFNCSGYRPRVYINARCKTQRGDIFSHMSELDFDLYYFKVEGVEDWEYLKKQAQCEDVEFICISTLQSDGIAKWATQIGKPIIGVIHNVKLFLASEHCYSALMEGQLQVLTLAHHVAVFLHQRIDKSLTDRVGVIEPIFFGLQFGECKASKLRTEERIVVIPGGVNFQTRDYYALIEALEVQKLSRNLDGVIFKVLGGGSDRVVLEKEVADRGLSSYIQFAPLSPSGMVLYEDYFAALREATFLHPLIPLSFWHYREHKITSAIPTAIGFNLPMVIDRWTAHTYRIPALVSDATLTASVACLIKTEEAEIEALRETLSVYYHLTLSEGAEEVKRLIYASVGSQ